MLSQLGDAIEEGCDWTNAEWLYWLQYMREVADWAGLQTIKVVLLRTFAPEDVYAQILSFPKHGYLQVKLNRNWRDYHPWRQRASLTHEVLHFIVASLARIYTSVSELVGVLLYENMQKNADYEEERAVAHLTTLLVLSAPLPPNVYIPPYTLTSALEASRARPIAPDIGKATGRSS